MNEMTKYNNSNLITSIDDVDSMSKMIAKTGVFGNNPGEAFVKILAGKEMGIGAYAAMTSINLIKGKLSMSANLLAAKVKSSNKYDYRVVELNDQVCKLAWYQQGEKIGENSFTREDARRAGTQNLDRFPQNMLFARALSNGVRFHCPDIFLGVSAYIPDEIEHDDEPARTLDGNDKAEYVAEPVDAGYIDIEEVPVEVPQPAAQPLSEETRPYTAEVFKDKFQSMAQKVLLKNHLDAIGEKEMKLVADAIDNTLGDLDDRAQVLEYLTGKGDITAIGKHYLKALCSVMDINHNQPVPSEVSRTEIKGIYQYLNGSEQ